jgi:hypothetical protein
MVKVSLEEERYTSLRLSSLYEIDLKMVRRGTAP